MLKITNLDVAFNVLVYTESMLCHSTGNVEWLIMVKKLHRLFWIRLNLPTKLKDLCPAGVSCLSMKLDQALSYHDPKVGFRVLGITADLLISPARTSGA